MKRIALPMIALLWAGTARVQADVRPNPLFQNGMVLQRDAKVPVWGTAAPGEKIEVHFLDQIKKSTAGADGNWRVDLDNLKAGGPYEMSIKGANTLKFKDVLVGEVWVCAGQSNMGFKVSEASNAEVEIAAANYPQIRWYEPAKAANRGAQWVSCSPAAIPGFSAVAYFYARELHKTLNVPVGLFLSKSGGTWAEAWIPLSAARANPALKRDVADWDQRVKQSAKTAKKAAPADQDKKAFGRIYADTIAPLIPYAIRGAIWDQGEANGQRGFPQLYGDLLQTLIGVWRSAWGQGDFPFYAVQLQYNLPLETQPSQPDGWVFVREGMRRALAIPNTGMAVTVDIGVDDNMHPKEKQLVGKRLALWALAKTYGKDIVYSGPLYKSMRIDGGNAILSFDCVGGGLMAKGGGALKGFAVAGKDGKCVWADARIVDHTISVSSAEVAEPSEVRYDWARHPFGNLVNKEGLPASPFKTSAFPDAEEEKLAAGLRFGRASD